MFFLIIFNTILKGLFFLALIVMAPKRSKKSILTTRQKAAIAFIIVAVGFFCGVTGINALSIWQFLNPNVVFVPVPVTVDRWHNNTILPPSTLTLTFTASATATVTHYNQTKTVTETTH